MIGERHAVRAFMLSNPCICVPFEVELRGAPPTTDPRDGTEIPVPPVVILWEAERPLAVGLRTVVAVAPYPQHARVIGLLEATALDAGLAVERVHEGALWRLFDTPPRTWLAR